MILGVSFDTAAENKLFAEKFAFPFRLLSDPKRAVALAYGAAESARDAYPRRYTFLIGPDGAIDAMNETWPGNPTDATLIA